MSETTPEQQASAAAPDQATQDHAELEQRVAALEGAAASSSGSSSSSSSQASPASLLPLSFEQVETGRTHTLNGVTEPIADSEGNPETEWTLFAIVDGTKVPLLTKPGNFVANWKIREQRLAERDRQTG